MAIKTYRVGKVLIEASQIFSLDNATLNITMGAGETTGIGEDWRDMVALGKQATLNLTCSYNPSDGAQAMLRTEFMTGDGALSAVQMWEDASHYFAASGMLVTTCNITKTVGSVDKVSFTLEAKGAISYT